MFYNSWITPEISGACLSDKTQGVLALHGSRPSWGITTKTPSWMLNANLITLTSVYFWIFSNWKKVQTPNTWQFIAWNDVV
jgi:hypothetical protein